jgi:hypothetical protein
VRHSAAEATACDLHALGTPPAFVLSQDQTLHTVLEPLAEARGVTETHTIHRHDSVVKVRRAQANKKPDEGRCLHLATSPVQARRVSLDVVAEPDLFGLLRKK